MVLELGKEEKKIEDKVYRLKEMHDSMKQSLDNISKVKAQQVALISLLKQYAAEKFAEFISELEEQINKIDEQTKTLIARFELLTQVLNKCDENEDCEHLVNTLLNALGLFD